MKERQTLPKLVLDLTENRNCVQIKKHIAPSIYLQRLWVHIQGVQQSSSQQNLSCVFYQMQSNEEILEHAQSGKT